MDKGNDSVITEFILQGFTDNPKMQLVLFFIFLSIYLTAVLGNVGMILLICTNTQLHKPMYYFLGNLSFVDLCCSSTIAPRMLIDLLSESKRISYNACATQLFFYVFFVDIECVLLAVMAYDRYVAICNPLLYSAAMSKMLCQQLIAFAYCIGLMDTIIYTSSTFLLTFCRSNLINHFFCDMPPLFVLSCSDTYVNELVLLIIDGFIEACSICMSLISYVYIVVTILRMHSAEGRRKAFSTCASHLTAVGIFHGTIVFMYIRPTSSYSMDQDKWASMFYTVVIPMLNPLIYSLRNKEVKDAVIKSIHINKNKTSIKSKIRKMYQRMAGNCLDHCHEKWKRYASCLVVYGVNWELYRISQDFHPSHLNSIMRTLESLCGEENSYLWQT
ncbi:olfactory receptor 5AR1-like [Ahaetulla prasina]|uniref:olfactory receptor 5AR1-like n=1 Tax=Ahaetulla prasina TaxID=499056 RepID=UPI002647BA14|nr:olfactory receptor 5AR1-like [Ahaetulla prasina]